MPCLPKRLGIQKVSQNYQLLLVRLFGHTLPRPNQALGITHFNCHMARREIFLNSLGSKPITNRFNID